MPSLRSIMALQQRKNKDEINDNYVYFCEKFLKHVVGVQSFNRAWKKKRLISELATPSDEALALIILENSEMRWNAEFTKIERGETVDKYDKQLPKPLYTSPSNQENQKGFTKKYGGWSEAGIERFNQLYMMVKVDRERHGHWFDQVVVERICNNEKNDTEAKSNQIISVAANNDLFGNEKKKEENESLSGDESGNNCEEEEV